MPERTRSVAIVLLVALLFGLAGIAAAHGSRITYTLSVTVMVNAAFDSGEPMANAQVTVYAPDDPAAPWLTGQTDEDGSFSFAPDPQMPGLWDVQVRSAGHGDIVHIPVNEGAVLSGGTGYAPEQIALMAVSVIWGFVGTALYFSRRRLPAGEAY
jgi:nickel transport protein